MFIAEMWAIGEDPQCVGVDGIQTCMGVFVAYNQTLYAIHSPGMTDATNRLGRLAFVYYIKKQNPQFKGKHAKLYAVVNGNHRNQAEEEVREYQSDLKAGASTFIRLHHNVLAAAVVCEFLPNGTSVVLKYKLHANAGWQNGLGQPRATHYHMANPDHRFGVASTSVAQGWQLVNYTIADLKSLD